MKKYFLFAFTLILFVSAMISAQQTSPSTISGGILNDKAIELPQPVYPSQARAVRATGNVMIAVTVDEQGNVITATAVSGHVLLRSTSETAARLAKFNPTYLSGKPVKVVGTIVYEFTTPIDWSSVGFALGDAEVEIGETSRLVSIVNTLERRFADESRATKVVLDNYSKDENNFRNQPAAIGQIIRSLQVKIIGQKDDSWWFEFGLAFGRIQASSYDEQTLRENLSKIEEFRQAKSGDLSETYSDTLEELAEIANKPNFSRKDKKRIKQLVDYLWNL